MKFVFKNDGDEIDKKTLLDWEIEKNCSIYSGKIKLDFVGYILKKDEIFVSFPKRFNYNNLKEKERILLMKNIVNIIFNLDSSYGNFDLGDKTLFPLRVYYNIVNYYKKYGLHFRTIKNEKKGYSGVINWNKTFKKSNLIIDNGNPIYLPFIINEKYNVSTFISECMEYVLYEVNLKFKDLLNNVVPYLKFPNNKIFYSPELCYKNLKSIQNKYFKDSEKKLIDSLIMYFNWKSNEKNFKMITNKFENCWENMIHYYLNNYFIGINEEDMSMIKSKEKNNNIKFEKSKSEYLEEKEKGYSIEFDHISINDNEKIIYLFDSKYFKEDISSFNYKQAMYYYYLKNLYENKGYIIYNGLIIPTDDDDKIKKHIDREKIENVETDKRDGLKIIEYYLNLKNIIDLYLKK